MYRVLTAIFTLLMIAATPVAAQKAGIGAWENPRQTIIGWIEETPYNGDYYANAAGVPQLRDPYQMTHTVYVRTLYRFY